jgi:hypothetical protein
VVTTAAMSAPALNHQSDIDHLDQKLTARSVARRYDVSTRTLDRWLTRPHMHFPKPVMFTYDVAGRVAGRYWRLGDLAAWEQRQAVSGAALRETTTP